MSAGCSGSSGRTPAPGPSSTGAASPSATSGAEPVRLRLAVYGDATTVTAYRALARAFETRRPEVSVDVESEPSAAQAQRSIREEFAVGSAPDVFVSDDSALPEWVASRRVRPVDELLEDRGIQFGDNYERLGLEAMAANSQLQCMPFDVSPEVLYYNPELLDLTTAVEPGEPELHPERRGWKWSQLVAALQGSPLGAAAGVYLPPDLTTLALLVRSAGTDIVDDPIRPTTLTLADDAGEVRQILELARDRRLSPSRAGLTRESALKMFTSRRLAAMVGTRADLPTLRRTESLDFDVYPVPGLTSLATIAQVRGYCISRTSAHVGVAADFLAFASGNRGSTIMSRSGSVVPANLDVQQSRAFRQPHQLPAKSDIYTRIIRRASSMPNPVTWPTMARAVQPALNRLFYGRDYDLQALLTRIDTRSARILSGPTASPSPGG